MHSLHQGSDVGKLSQAGAGLVQPGHGVRAQAGMGAAGIELGTLGLARKGALWMTQYGRQLDRQRAAVVQAHADALRREGIGIHAAAGCDHDALRERQTLRVIQRLSREVVQPQPALQQRMAAAALRPVADRREAFTRRMVSDLALYGEIFKAAGIQPE